MSTSMATGVRKLPRVAIVVAAVVSALIVFGIESLFTTVQTPAANGQPVRDLNALFVILGSGIAALAGWGLLVLLEKFTAKGAMIWRIVAAVALLLSLGGPFGGTGITSGSRLSLAALHIVVGAVLIAALPSAGTKSAD